MKTAAALPSALVTTLLFAVATASVPTGAHAASQGQNGSGSSRTQARSAASALAASAPAGDPTEEAGPAQNDHLYALLINGGGRARINYQSHLLHLKQIRRLLVSSGLPSDHISIFASDGADPADDVAVRAAKPEVDDLWRVAGTRAWRTLTPPIRYESSTIEGSELHPATQEELTHWFDEAGKRLAAGDTLLVYVTDHGEENKDDHTDNTITLWGKDEKLSVTELGDLLSRLDPGVRVVMLMSQCYSGSFANLVGPRTPKNRPVGNTCGFFSSTEDRRAYGCYPENLGRDNVGHSFRFINALADGRTFASAHLDVLETDATPDVPLRTSDVYLAKLLHDAADRAGKDYEPFVDGLLDTAWRNKASWEPEIRRLDRIGKTYGYFSPRSLSELDEQTTRLPDIAGQMQNVSTAWRGALGDANQANFKRFAAAHPEWTARFDAADEALAALRRAESVALASKDDDSAQNADSSTEHTDDSAEHTDSATEHTGEAGTGRAANAAKAAEALAPEARAAMRDEFLKDFIAYTRADAPTEAKLVTLHEKGEDAAATSYRMEVRLAVVLRMRTLLENIAGRVYLDTGATDEERAAYRALTACEALRLASPEHPSVALAEPEPFPPFEDDVRRATAALPAWMGIRFNRTEKALQDKYHLADGAARVMVVYPGSPAEKAGIQNGDIVVGEPDQPFDEVGQIRSWTMMSIVGVSRKLELLRDGEPVRVTLVPGSYPLKWPELPGPPEIGEAAPPVELSAYRGDVDGALSGPHLLFFWATWCGPCKLSVPEVLDFERLLGVPVIAVTDELPEQLDSFFENREEEFPQRVAIDRHRQSFLNYGVSGTPTFVYVDEHGKVAGYSSGYDKDTGLGKEVRALMDEAKAKSKPKSEPE